MNWIIGPLLIVYASVSFGGSIAGNGGDVVVCGDTVELFDFFEGRKVPPIREIALETPTNSVREKLSLISSNI